MNKVVFTQRENDWYATLKDDSKIWGCGKTKAEALGELVLNHPGKLNIELEHPQG